MPCRDYEDETNYEVTLKKRNDELARYACVFASVLHDYAEQRRIPLEELTNTIVAKSPEYGIAAVQWYERHQAADKAAQERAAKAAALKKKGIEVIRKLKLGTLTRAEREALHAVGVSLPPQKKKKRSVE
jgi:hypothetical protein